jgi:hypothetical protein
LCAHGGAHVCPWAIGRCQEIPGLSQSLTGSDGEIALLPTYRPSCSSYDY